LICYIYCFPSKDTIKKRDIQIIIMNELSKSYLIKHQKWINFIKNHYTSKKDFLRCKDYKMKIARIIQYSIMLRIYILFTDIIWLIETIIFRQGEK